MTDIDLGFPEERDSAWLTNRYFPSKVGGRPAWLELDALPPKELLQCKKCQTPKAFLCQIYAPFDDEHNFHRTILVFVCRTSSCQVPNSAENLTVLRSQLSRNNDYYSAEPPAEDGNPLPAMAAKRKLCLACGCLGPMSCSRCKKANYCSTQHQRAHWPHHKAFCAADKDEVALSVDIPGILFPIWEIVMEPNDNTISDDNIKDNEDEEAVERARLAEFEKLSAAGKTGELKDLPDSELDKYTQSTDAVDDKHFRKFKKEVSKDPDQVLRYKRNGQPLWIADVAQTLNENQLNIPKCECCGDARQFEFQIMPQMLLLLKDEHLDWGVMAVYTCAKSCKPAPGVGYIQEYIVKQDILPDKP